MPIISKFFGIIIRMFYDEHNPAHIHTEYQNKKAVFDFHGRLIGVIAVEIDLFPDELPYSSDLLSSETILAYPMDVIIEATDNLIASTKKKRTYLGIVAADWPSQLGGAHVKQIHSNSPAARGGFRGGRCMRAP